MTEQFVNRTLTDLCLELCSSAENGALLVNPSSRVIEALADYGVEHQDRFPSLRLLAEEWSLKQSLSKFTTASRMADLIEHDLIEVKYLPNPPKSSMAVDSGKVIVIIDAGTSVGTLSTDDTDFVSTVNQSCASQFEQAEQYILHTPAISRVMETLEGRLGSDRRETFQALVDAADGRTDHIDEVTISLLVAATYQDLLYDISKWGEDIGLASKATFSRKKTELEDHDIIDTDPEPIDVGRPRLRLRFTEPYLERASADEVIEEVSSRFE